MKIFNLFSSKKNRYLTGLNNYLNLRNIADEAFVLDLKNPKKLGNYRNKIEQSSLSIVFSSDPNHLTELKKLNLMPAFVGTTYDKNYVSIHGKLAQFKKVPDKKVLAIVSTFNDEDIISQVLDFLLSQRLDILVIDNWSKDKTLDIVKSKIKHNPNKIFLEKYPTVGPIDSYQWADLLDFKVNNKYSKNYEWLIHYDSDEIRISPWIGKDLVESISFVDSLGFNAIDFTVIDFRPTEDGFNTEYDPREFFKYFEFGTRPGHFLQIKAWKNFGQKVDIRTHFGHDVLFEGKKIFPLKFLLKHYPLRSSKYAKKKIFKDRLPRYLEKLRKVGIDRTYDKYTKEDSFIWNKNDLLEYESDEDFLHKYLLQFLFGVGIKND